MNFSKLLIFAIFAQNVGCSTLDLSFPGSPEHRENLQKSNQIYGEKLAENFRRENQFPRDKKLHQQFQKAVPENVIIIEAQPDGKTFLVK